MLGKEYVSRGDKFARHKFAAARMVQASAMWVFGAVVIDLLLDEGRIAPHDAAKFEDDPTRIPMD
jgi:hypothetical protein